MVPVWRNGFKQPSRLLLGWIYVRTALALLPAAETLLPRQLSTVSNAVDVYNGTWSSRTLVTARAEHASVSVPGVVTIFAGGTDGGGFVLTLSHTRGSHRESFSLFSLHVLLRTRKSAVKVNI
jgi:hypothetical protein